MAEQDGGRAARLASAQAYELARAIESGLRLSLWVIDNHLNQDHVPGAAPDIDDVARHLELTINLCAELRRMLEARALVLNDNELSDWLRAKRPLWGDVQAA